MNVHFCQSCSPVPDVGRATCFTTWWCSTGRASFRPNPSLGTGAATASYDDPRTPCSLEAGLQRSVRQHDRLHIHAPTAIPFSLTNTAGVATTTPTFAGFPWGDQRNLLETLNLRQSSSYNPAYVTPMAATPQTPKRR